MFSYKTSEQTNPVLMRLAEQLAKVKLRSQRKSGSSKKLFFYLVTS
jgi:hypothetical protein